MGPRPCRAPVLNRLIAQKRSWFWCGHWVRLQPTAVRSRRRCSRAVPGTKPPVGAVHPALSRGSLVASGLYQVSLIMTHRDGFPRFSARSAWRGDAPASRATGPVHKHWAARKPWEAVVPVARAKPRMASESLDDAPHRRRLPSCPADRPRDLYGSLSTRIGIKPIVSLGLGWQRRNGVNPNSFSIPPQAPN